MDSLPLFPNDDNIPLKRCPRCPEGQQWHPATTEHFHRHKTTKDGLYGYCKQCKLQEAKSYRIKHPEEMKARAAKYQAEHPEQRKLYRERHREELREYNRRYSSEHREEIRIQRQLYYQQHQEHLRRYSAQYRAEHPEEVRRYSANYNASAYARLMKSRYNAAHREKNRIAKAKWDEQHREEQRQYRAQYNATHREERLRLARIRRAELREYLNERYRRYRQTDHARMMHRTHENNRRARKRRIAGTLSAEQIQHKLKAQKYKCYYCFARFEKNEGEYIFHLEHTIPVSRLEYEPRHDVNYVVLACPSCNIKKNNKLPHEWTEGGRLL